MVADSDNVITWYDDDYMIWQQKPIEYGYKH